MLPSSLRLSLPVLALAFVGLLGLGAASPAAAEHRFGLGVNYWKTVDDLVDEGFDVEEEGLAPVLTYQYRPGGILGLQVDLEYFDQGFGGATSEAISPQVYLTVGNGFYGAVGIGVTYSSDFADDFSDPFYAARVGFDFLLLPKIHLDIHANYRAGSFDELDQASTDTVILGAAVRAGL